MHSSTATIWLELGKNKTDAPRRAKFPIALLNATGINRVHSRKLKGNHILNNQKQKEVFIYLYY